MGRIRAWVWVVIATVIVVIGVLLAWLWSVLRRPAKPGPGSPGGAPDISPSPVPPASGGASGSVGPSPSKSGAAASRGAGDGGGCDTGCERAIEDACNEIVEDACNELVGATCGEFGKACGNTVGQQLLTASSTIFLRAAAPPAALPAALPVAAPAAAAAPVGRLGVTAIRAYRRWISPRLKVTCRYEPSCSTYGLTAVERHGALAGAQLALARIHRCTPAVPLGTPDPCPA